MRSTIGDLDSKENSVGFLRILCALLVIVGHAFPLGGYGKDPLLVLTNNQVAIGRFPVDVFFCLSGYLIASSYIRQDSFWRFVWARFLRIYPAFWVCIFLTGVPLAYWGRGAPDFGYILNNVLLLRVDNSIDGLFPGQRDGVNGSLWTLPWEVRAYACVGLLGLLGLLRRKFFVAIIFALVYAYFVWIIFRYPGVDTSPAVTSGARLLTFFFVGAMFYLFREKIPVDGGVALVGVFLLFSAAIVGTLYVPYSGGLFYAVAPVPLTYCVFYLAIRLPVVFRRINSRADFSYGVYIYGTLLLNIFASLELGVSLGVYLLLTVVVTLIFSALSWYLIEKPAMSLKRLGRSVSPRLMGS